MSQTIRLNLGCSSDLFDTAEGWVNVDCRTLPGVDVVADLAAVPWPWADCSVDEVYASHVLEHLDDPLSAMQEIARILKPGGKVRIIVPNGAGYMAHAIGHKSLLSRQWFLDLSGNPDNQNDCGKLFVDTTFRFGIWHHRIPWGRVTGFIFSAWENWWNKNWIRQTAWEMSGFVVPGECRWEAKKPVKSAAAETV